MEGTSVQNSSSSDISPKTEVEVSQNAEAPAGRFATSYRKAHQALGFNKAYNFPLFIIFAGAMLGFSLARVSYMNIAGPASSSYANSASPGEWYWYEHGHYRIGITMHLITVLPAGLLMIWQFIPIIRQKFLLFHRINGYLIWTLITISNVGALMIARRAFGGTLDTQAAVGTLVILTTTSIFMACYNIKKLQIEQHRAWMLRGMFYMGTIITVRLIQITAALSISAIGSYYTTMTCQQLASQYDGGPDESADFAAYYPQCANASALPFQRVTVLAKFEDQSEQIGVSLGLPFGMALWLALLIHLIGVEIYLNMTPRETERLRKVSYQKQLERGFKNPGSAGLTVDRWGDSEPYVP
ncbi:hypothetical protein PVAG01_00176 [Phlyctema vagabunda]|uniref:Uncharacterized protein n=1 Tax=Phlyctema vagabunda TaxID=108571 RepID=A0ABR4PU38_9HELO